MALPWNRSRFGRASCVVFALVAACVAGGAVGLATLPPPGGSDFPAGSGQAIASGVLLAWGWGLSLVGAALGLVGALQPGSSKTAAIGLGLNALFAVAGTWWIATHS